MAAYLIVPTPEPARSYDYGGIYREISSSLNQVRQELNDIDVDTTESAATLKLIAASLGTIAVNSTIMAANSTTIADKLTAMETYQKKLKELGEGPGIHVIGPYDWIGIVALYKLFIEEGDILDVTDDVSEDQSAAALAKFKNYINKIKALPTEF